LFRSGHESSSPEWGKANKVESGRAALTGMIAGLGGRVKKRSQIGKETRRQRRKRTQRLRMGVSSREMSSI